MFILSVSQVYIPPVYICILLFTGFPFTCLHLSYVIPCILCFPLMFSGCVWCFVCFLYLWCDSGCPAPAGVLSSFTYFVDVFFTCLLWSLKLGFSSASCFLLCFCFFVVFLYHQDHWCLNTFLCPILLSHICMNVLKTFWELKCSQTTIIHLLL